LEKVGIYFYVNFYENHEPELMIFKDSKYKLSQFVLDVLVL